MVLIKPLLLDNPTNIILSFEYIDATFPGVSNYAITLLSIPPADEKSPSNPGYPCVSIYVSEF